jgi:hypothetical protein
MSTPMDNYHPWSKYYCFQTNNLVAGNHIKSTTGEKYFLSIFHNDVDMLIYCCSENQKQPCEFTITKARGRFFLEEGHINRYNLIQYNS